MANNKSSQRKKPFRKTKKNQKTNFKNFSKSLVHLYPPKLNLIKVSLIKSHLHITKIDKKLR